ncbi:aldo/keto reductase [Microbulbifer rhizosphaerae]|uniref:Aryl-alcohol dehydrogenase-like predicted oxidoreductase n=1 Tax=Microbulbifer rhizosphaerae TaxID=1562603 RepID=A0A7W4WF24_9GAMM|nr:aldo/keto reductase [Microbulbifer rhizosphaerae]MBB3062391.1 aryl-alcohol dehydrogenase-like predicted oxidoreductase [Microbulbifer rhizosphaerae]
MNTRRLGKTGYQVSEIGLGCWQLGGDFGPVAHRDAETILADAERLRVTFWDTADVYGDGLSEQRISSFLRKQKGGQEGQQKEQIVATKVGRSSLLYPDKYTRHGVRESLQNSAKRLGVEAIDLAQLHCVPPEVLGDGEIFTWLDDLKSEGLIRHYGASVETIEEAFLCLEHDGLASLQIIFNLFRQDAKLQLLDAARQRDVGIIVRLPLASGLLSGKFTRDTRFATSDHRNYNRDGEAFSVGETFGGIPFGKGIELTEGLRELLPGSMDMVHFALRWILDHEAVSTIIAGVSKPGQIGVNVEAAGLPPLDPAIHEKVFDYYQDAVKPFIRGKI